MSREFSFRVKNFFLESRFFSSSREIFPLVEIFSDREFLVAVGNFFSGKFSVKKQPGIPCQPHSHARIADKMTAGKSSYDAQGAAQNYSCHFTLAQTQWKH